VGNYSYGAGSAGPHAVTSVSGSVASTYNYNANGDMTSGNGRTVTWSPMGKPTQMARGSNTVNIVYGPDRSRIERRDTKSGITSTTTYVQGLFEKVVEPGETSYRFYVGSLAIVTQSTTQGTSTAYPLRDHQESVVGQMDAGGSPVEYLNYNAWGERLQGNAGSLPVDDTFEAVISPRGYTDHEHLDGVRLIHMNGRVYDPELGRFMSADPLIQAPDNTQSFNRYSYVFNNPMSFTDPSGFACINGMSIGLFPCGDSRGINYDDGFGSFITADIGAIGIDFARFGILPVDTVTVGGSFLQVTEIDKKEGNSQAVGSKGDDDDDTDESNCAAGVICTAQQGAGPNTPYSDPIARTKDALLDVKTLGDAEGAEYGSRLYNDGENYFYTTPYTDGKKDRVSVGRAPDGFKAGGFVHNHLGTWPLSHGSHRSDVGSADARGITFWGIDRRGFVGRYIPGPAGSSLGSGTFQYSGWPVKEGGIPRFSGALR